MKSNNAKKQKKRKRSQSGFKLSARLQAIVPLWRSLDGVPPKITAVVDSCSMSEVYSRLERGEYQAIKDGRNLKILTASMIARREKLPRAEFRVSA